MAVPLTRSSSRTLTLWFVMNLVGVIAAIITTIYGNMLGWRVALAVNVAYVAALQPWTWERFVSVRGMIIMSTVCGVVGALGIPLALAFDVKSKSSAELPEQVVSYVLSMLHGVIGMYYFVSSFMLTSR